MNIRKTYKKRLTKNQQSVRVRIVPNSEDMPYHIAAINQKVLVVSGNRCLTPVERKHLDDILDEHLKAIEAHFKDLAPKSIINCLVCHSPLAEDGKCPKRLEKGHIITR